MSHAASLHAHQPASRAGASLLLSVLLVAWVALIVALGARGVRRAARYAAAAPARGGGRAGHGVSDRIPGVPGGSRVAWRRISASSPRHRPGDSAGSRSWPSMPMGCCRASSPGPPDSATWPSATVPWMLAGLVREPGFATSRRLSRGTSWGSSISRRRQRRRGGAAAVSRRGRRELDGRDGPPPARVDPRVLRPGLSHPACHRAGAGASSGGRAHAMKIRTRSTSMRNWLIREAA